jgi:hypothetical protein
MEWKWTKGEPYERSRRIYKQVVEDEVPPKQIETSAYTSALHHDENTWDILNIKSSNKREDLDAKIAERAPVQQCGFNPFLGDNNYVKAITEYPMNTTIEKSVKANQAEGGRLQAEGGRLQAEGGHSQAEGGNWQESNE